MDAVKFLRTYRRMCRFYETCKKEGCPMKEVPHCDLHDPELDIEKAVEAAEKWGKEHPEKTMAQDFFEKFPNAPRTVAGFPRLCPSQVGYENPKDDSICNRSVCHKEKCWGRLLEEL